MSDDEPNCKSWEQLARELDRAYADLLAARRERDESDAALADAVVTRAMQKRRAEAAEADLTAARAECARLREALAWYAVCTCQVSPCQCSARIAVRALSPATPSAASGDEGRVCPACAGYSVVPDKAGGGVPALCPICHGTGKAPARDEGEEP